MYVRTYICMYVCVSRMYVCVYVMYVYQHIMDKIKNLFLQRKMKTIYVPGFMSQC